MESDPRNLNHITSRIIRAAINVHAELGPGLLESVYDSCMNIELREMGIKTENQVVIPILYKGHPVANQVLRLDLLVEDRIVVELKSVDKIQDVHKKQLLTYLKIARKPLGLLVNFNEPLLRDGIVRIAN